MKLLACRRVVLVSAVAAAASFSAIGLFGGPALAADAPAQLIQGVADEVIQIVKQAKGPDREAAIGRILATNFDMGYMGRAALGTHWDGTTGPERDRYVGAIHELLAAIPSRYAWVTE